MDVTTTLGFGATLAILVAFIKQGFPDLPSRALPLVVLALASVVIGVGAVSGEVEGGPFALIELVVAQTATAIGLRSAAVAAVPRVSGGMP